MNAKAVFQNKYLKIILAIFTALLWGSAFPVVKIGFEAYGIPPEQTMLKILFAGYRFLLAGLLIIIFSVIAGQNFKLRPKQIKDVFLLGWLNTTVQYLFFYIGISNTTASKGAVLTSALVFFTFILAHYFLPGDRMNKRKIWGLIMGFTGVVIVNYSPALLTFDFQLAGEGFLLVSQISGAVAAIYLKKISDSVSVLVITAYQMILGSLFLIVPAAWTVGLWPFAVSYSNFYLLIYLALVSAVAFGLWNTLIKYNLVGQITIFQFLIPIFGVMLANLMIKEHVTMTMIISLVTVSAGIISVNIFASSKFSENRRVSNGRRQP